VRTMVVININNRLLLFLLFDQGGGDDTTAMKDDTEDRNYVRMLCCSINDHACLHHQSHAVITSYLLYIMYMHVVSGQQYVCNRLASYSKYVKQRRIISYI
jgi:hypothetical protein